MNAGLSSVDASHGIDGGAGLSAVSSQGLSAGGIAVSPVFCSSSKRIVGNARVSAASPCGAEKMSLPCCSGSLHGDGAGSGCGSGSGAGGGAVAAVARACSMSSSTL